MYLPPEQRNMILDNVAVDNKHPGYGALTSVCKEWQAFLEGPNFRHLHIKQYDLNQFKSIMLDPQKRRLVRHISFDMELPSRVAPGASQRSQREGSVAATFGAAMLRLYTILSKWEPDAGLTLELKATYLGDAELFPHLYFSSDDVDGDEDILSDDELPYPDHDGADDVDPFGLWSPVPLNTNRDLPRVEAVTRLIIRREFRRGFEPANLGYLVDRLARLKDMVLEPWGPLQITSNILYHEAIYMYFTLPCAKRWKNRTRLSIFQDIPDEYDLFRDAHQRWDMEITTTVALLPSLPDVEPKYILTVALICVSRTLQHLTIGNMIHAEQFFGLCEPFCFWPRLETLALTSKYLGDAGKEKRKECRDLLYTAAVWVQRMPQLITLVIWNGGRRNACAFIYRVDSHGKPSITWRGNWRLEYSHRVIEAWKIIASTTPRQKERHEPLPLETRYEHIEHEIRSHAEAIYRLKLPCQVVHPASLWQMRREARNNVV